MKMLFLFYFVFVLHTFYLSSTHCYPQGYGIPSEEPSKKCVTELKEIYDVVYEETIVPICETKINKVCAIKEKEECRVKKDKICSQVMKNKCTQIPKEDCKTEFKFRDVPITETKCLDVEGKECEKGWENGPYGEKLWRDNVNKCTVVKRTQCKPLTIVKQIKEPFQKCETHLEDDCKAFSVEECKDIEVPDCRLVPFEDCQDLSFPMCHDEHKKIPKQISKKVPIERCDNEEYNNEIVSPRTADIAAELKAGKPSPDSIIFGQD